MSRKKVEINEKCGKRLSELLRENGITQQCFAEQIGYTEQHISLLVTAKRRLTSEAAKQIVAIFPPVRLEWLMGYDDFKTPADKNMKEINKFFNDSRGILAAFSTMASLAGYDIVLFDNIDELGRGKIQDALRNVNEGYKVYYNGKLVAKCSLENFNSTAYEVYNYTEFLMQKIVKKVAK